MNEEVKAAIRLKRERERASYKSLSRCRDNATYENYKVAKSETRKAVQKAIFKDYDELYRKFGRRMEKRIFINLLRQGNENKRLELCQVH